MSAESDRQTAENPRQTNFQSFRPPGICIRRSIQKNVQAARFPLSPEHIGAADSRFFLRLSGLFHHKVDDLSRNINFLYDCHSLNL